MRCEVAIAPHEAPHVRRLAAALQGEMSRAEFMAALGLADRSHFLRTYLLPSLDAGLIEMTRPQSPRRRNQRYRLTALGREAGLGAGYSGHSGRGGMAQRRHGRQLHPRRTRRQVAGVGRRGFLTILLALHVHGDLLHHTPWPVVQFLGPSSSRSEWLYENMGNYTHSNHRSMPYIQSREWIPIVAAKYYRFVSVAQLPSMRRISLICFFIRNSPTTGRRWSRNW